MLEDNHSLKHAGGQWDLQSTHLVCDMKKRWCGCNLQRAVAKRMSLVRTFLLQFAISSCGPHLGNKAQVPEGVLWSSVRTSFCNCKKQLWPGIFLFAVRTIHWMPTLLILVDHKIKVRSALLVIPRLSKDVNKSMHFNQNHYQFIAQSKYFGSKER